MTNEPRVFHPSVRRWSEVAPLWAIFALAGIIAWVYTVGRARDMGVGPGTMGIAFWLFTGMWVAMMAAMMLPAIGPLAAEEGAHASGSAGGVSQVASTLAVGVGFLVPWTLYGCAAFVLLLGTGRLVDGAPEIARWLGVAILALAGLYQFTALKQRALEHCRMPMAGPTTGTFARGLLAGARDGAICVGCCWALMTVLFATGLMNLATMAGLAVVIIGEKLLPRTKAFSVVVGVALLGLAIAAVVHPALLRGMRPAASSMHMGTSPSMGGM